MQKYQAQSIIENIATDTIPEEFRLQCQTGLLVSEREWLDFITYSGGMPMATVRVYPDEKYQTAIVEAATAFEERLTQKMAIYEEVMASKARLIPTERRIEQEMFI